MLEFLKRLFGSQGVAEPRNIRIYVSYRRSDSLGFAGRISDRLAAHFGTENIFTDTDSIPPGADFRQTLNAEIGRCDVMLALMGHDWVSSVDSEGRRRVDNPGDFIRAELETALAQSLPIVPVIVDGAGMPPANSLPESIQPIAYRNAAAIRQDPDFHRDVDRLIEGIESLVQRSPSRQERDIILRSSESTVVPNIDEAIGSTPTVFVSHSTDDRKWVEERIVGLIQDNGMNPWYAQTSIQSATQWEREILKGLESCDWFILVVSPRAETSEWVKDELNWAFYHRPSRIVPILMEPSNLWAFHIRLPRIQYIDFTSSSAHAREQLVDRLKEPE